MDKEKIKAFLTELDELSDKYGIEVTAEGALLLYDEEEKKYIGEFGKSVFGGGYKFFGE